MAVQSAPLQQTIGIDTHYLQAKRLLDFVLTPVILLFCFPVFLMVSLLILIESKGHGSIFYRQRRVGQNGVEFDMLKFRSMYENADQYAHQEHILKYMNGETTGKIKNDPRITRVGRFIRKTSIDELPQFFNVLRGEMTLVGPRPPLPYEVVEYSEHDRLRLCGKPGVTGLWQVHGRNRVTFGKMVEMDIDYLQHQSILEDLELIALTLPVMVKGVGE